MVDTVSEQEMLDMSNNDSMESMELDEIVEEKPDWVEDNTVPPGYKRRIFEGNNSMLHFSIPGVLGPDGRQYKSRQNALRVMIKRGEPEEEIAKMTECLAYEGWERSEDLPQGWRYRKSSREEHKLHVQFLSDKADTFKSNKDAITYAQKFGGEVIVSQINAFLEMCLVESRIENYEWSDNSLFFKATVNYNMYFNSGSQDCQNVWYASDSYQTSIRDDPCSDSHQFMCEYTCKEQPGETLENIS